MVKGGRRLGRKGTGALLTSSRLRTFMNQPDIFGVASFVAKCLALFS